MAAPVPVVLNTRLKPWKSVVWRKCGMVCASVAIKTAVPPVINKAGSQCRPLPSSNGNSHMSFWSCRKFNGNLRNDTSRSSRGSSLEGCGSGKLAGLAALDAEDDDEDVQRESPKAG